jgi:hypothetical protein
LRNFDYSFLENGLLPARLVNITSAISEATVLNSLLPLSKKEIACILPDISPTTIEAVLASMVRGGAVEKLGNSRSTRYIPAKGQK